jgi:hypothetical protein
VYLCNKNNSIILRDNTGTETVLYTGASWRPMYPVPLRPRPKPPVLATKTWQGERATLPDHYRATLSVMDVYNSDLPLPAGVKIKWMRIVQVIPQLQPLMNIPKIGYGGESLARMALGIVPVESDGSVYCEAPVGKEVYFQLLDSNGCAIQSMRSGAYVHAGEQLTCIGCHENKWKAVPNYPPRQALQRPPSPITPEANGVEPVNFYRLVKPVFDAKCAACHIQQGKGPNMSYASLEPYAFYITPNTSDYLNDGTGFNITYPVHGGSRSIPGKAGALYSKLLPYCKSSHYNVSLTANELRRIVLWLDCNSNELGAYMNASLQRQGRLVWPEIDVDSLNPQGVEKNFPVPGVTGVMQRDHARYNAQPRDFSRVNVLTHGNSLIITKEPGLACLFKLFDLKGRMVYAMSLQPENQRVLVDNRTIKRAGSTYVAVLSQPDGKTLKRIPLLLSE